MDGTSARTMIDNFSLALTHGLMLLGMFLLLRRPDLDKEPGPHDRAPKRRNGARLDA